MSSTGAQTLFLHIGRGKSGSSTIQSLARDHVRFMDAAGVYCPLSVNGLPNHARLAAALCDSKHDFQSLRKLSESLQKSPHPKVFISGEALFSLTREGMERLKRRLDGREIRILAYVRDYPSWLQSVYAQRTKRATNWLDFDAYFKSLRKNVTILPRLERWAAVFGWQSLRVRTLDPAVLVGGNLVSDVLHALSVGGGPPKVPSLNTQPHWITLEVQRALAIAAGQSPLGRIDLPTAKITRQVVEACVAEIEPKRVNYLTHQQWRELANRYKQDMAAVGGHTGAWFPVSVEDPGERSFLPSLQAVPAAAKAAIMAKLREPDIARQLKPEIVALLGRVLTEEDASHPGGRVAAPPPNGGRPAYARAVALPLL